LSATWAALLGLLPLLFLVGFSGAVFFSELTGGPIFFGRDTTTSTQYYKERIEQIFPFEIIVVVG
jgi:hypothetical protein